jgi:large subunit ribosomal protein L28
MTRKCIVTGKTVMTGNNVSHANNRTRRRFLPNLQNTTLYSETLGQGYNFRLSTNAIRTIEHKGGLDAYVNGTAKTKLAPEFRAIKKNLENKAAKQAA